jgi:ribonuclease E
LDGTGGTVGRKVEKIERTKPSRSESLKVREETPQEVVSVSMTSEEQDVFAFMGISPLALYEGEVKNPRTAIIQVRLPGEPDTDTASSDLEQLAESSEVEAEFPDSDSHEPNHDIRSKLRNPADSLEAIVTTMVEPNEHPEHESQQTEPDEGASEARRRRRRSSAPATKAKQLSLGD